jgi:hypothetical protein
VHFSSKSRSSGWSDKTDSVDATEFSVELPESELCPDCAVFEELLNAVVLSEPDRSSVESLMFPVIAFQFVKNKLKRVLSDLSFFLPQLFSSIDSQKIQCHRTLQRMLILEK